MRLDGRVALVTGASSGIGKAAARLLAERGAMVACLGRRRQKLEEAIGRMPSAAHRMVPVEADVSDAPAMSAAIGEVIEKWGRLDILFANAGINGTWAPIDALEPHEFDQVIAVNLRGAFLSIKYAAPHLKQRGGSVIINSSINGTRVFSNTGATPYACSKAALVALGRMLALELARHRVRVNVICPGAIESNIGRSTESRGLEAAREPVEFPEGEIPLTRGKPGSAEQVAELVAFLASDAASHITGTEVWIDGAQSLLRG